MEERPRHQAYGSLEDSLEKSPECKEVLRKYEIVASSSIRKIRKASSARKLEAQLKCGMLTDEVSASSGKGGTGNKAMPTPVQQPSIITSCDNAGCWDNLGNRYNRSGGTTYFGPSGACQLIGNMMTCP